MWNLSISSKQFIFKHHYPNLKGRLRKYSVVPFFSVVPVVAFSKNCLIRNCPTLSVELNLKLLLLCGPLSIINLTPSPAIHAAAKNSSCPNTPFA
jgi:hypothetical protein